MSTSKMNVATDTLFASAKSTHYAVSTFAAVVYALVWMLSNGAHAESTNSQVTQATLPAIVVTAYRTMLPEVVVVGKRDASTSYAMLDAIVVTGTRDGTDTRIAAANSGYGTSAAAPRSGYAAKVRNWVRVALAKVSG